MDDSIELGERCVEKMEAIRTDVVQQCIQSYLKPFVKKIDREAYYPQEYLTSLGRNGLLQSDHTAPAIMHQNEVNLVESTSYECMTTGFNLWCHLAALTYVRNSDNPFLNQEIRSRLENGTLLGGTGLSNPMKFYAGLETLHLKAERKGDGYVITGSLPKVSNLGSDHWFGFVAELANEDRRIMGVIACGAEGLCMQEIVGYLALDGSATYHCRFDHVWIPDDWVVSHQADSFIPQIRPVFVLYQIPLGLGITARAIRSIEKVHDRQNGCNKYLPVQAADLAEELADLRARTSRLCQLTEKPKHMREYFEVRLASVNLALKAVQADMLHNGGTAYIHTSGPSRRLREAYFMANLTPTVKQLNKQLQ
jgi:alkylation response protein AidB-like acyl-CoA dehydrogenase